MLEEEEKIPHRNYKTLSYLTLVVGMLFICVCRYLFLSHCVPQRMPQLCVFVLL